MKTLIKWMAYGHNSPSVGFTIISNDEAENLKNKLINRKDEFTILFHYDNDDIGYSNGQKLLDELVFMDITEDEEKVFSKFIGYNNQEDICYGTVEFLLGNASF